MLKIVSIFLIALTTGSSVAVASGFLMAEQGVKAMGMGNAFSAIADDPSANWYNPAGLSFQKNASSISFALVDGNHAFEGGGQTYSAQKSVKVMPQIYTRYGLEDSNVSAGLGVNSPFELSTDWSGSGTVFSGVLANSDSITVSQIQTLHLNPNIAYQWGNQFAVAAGLSYYNVYKVHLDNQAVKFGGSGDGFGGNVAAMFKSDSITIALSYRSRVNIDVTGTVAGGPALAFVALEGVGTNAKTSFVLPDIATAALSFSLTDNLSLSLQADRINWKTFDQIVIEHDVSTLDMAVGTSSTMTPHWKATTAIRMGLNWKYSETSSLRFGYASEPDPNNEKDFTPRLPKSDRQLFSFGFGTVFFEGLTLDLAYAFAKSEKRIVALPSKTLYHGTYTSRTHLFAAGLSYRF